MRQLLCAAADSSIRLWRAALICRAFTLTYWALVAWAKAVSKSIWVFEGLHAVERGVLERFVDFAGAIGVFDQVADAQISLEDFHCTNPPTLFAGQQALGDDPHQRLGKEDAGYLPLVGGGKRSSMRLTVRTVSRVCGVEKTRWPVWAASRAAAAVA